MIKDFEFYHGAALTRLIHMKQAVLIKLFPSTNNASYVINEKIGLYLKHSTKRMSPWVFTFKKSQQNEIDKVYKDIGKIVIGLICHDDGVVGLNYDEFKILLKSENENVESIIIYRRPRKEYTVKGSDGKLKYKIGKKDFVNKILLST